MFYTVLGVAGVVNSALEYASDVSFSQVWYFGEIDISSDV